MKEMRETMSAKIWAIMGVGGGGCRRHRAAANRFRRPYVGHIELLECYDSRIFYALEYLLAMSSFFGRIQVLVMFDVAIPLLPSSAALISFSMRSIASLLSFKSSM